MSRIGVICCRSWLAESQGWEFVSFVPSKSLNALIRAPVLRLSSQHTQILFWRGGCLQGGPPFFHFSRACYRSCRCRCLEQPSQQSSFRYRQALPSQEHTASA